MRNIRSTVLIIGVLLVGTASVAVAQISDGTTNRDDRMVVAQASPAPTPMPPQASRPMMPGMPSMGAMPMTGHGGMVGMMMRMGEHVEGRIAFLRAELQITEAQTTLWNAFADTLRANAKKMNEIQHVMMAQGATPAALPQRLAQHEGMLSGHVEGFRAMKNALQPLYAALSVDQKRTADGLIHGPMGMGMM